MSSKQRLFFSIITAGNNSGNQTQTNGKLLEVSNSVKYLGLQIDNNLSFANHINSLYN